MNKKYIIISIFIFIFIILFGTNRFSNSDNNNKISSNNIEKDESVEKAYLELHFYHGKILRQEILYIWFPDPYSQYQGNRTFTQITNFSNWNYFNFNELDTFYPELWPNINVTLIDGKNYSFSEAYKMQFNEDLNTISLYLWRDEPYESEIEIFKEIIID